MCQKTRGAGSLYPYHLEGGCDLVVQRGTSKYEVRDQDGHLHNSKLAKIAEHQNIRMIEIKRAKLGVVSSHSAP